MQLSEAEALGVLDDHDVGIRHVDADLDHGRRHEDIQAAVGECLHGGVLGLVLHAAVQETDVLLTEQLRQVRVPLLGGGELRHVRAFDQRAHPIDLRAFLQLCA